MNATMYHTKRYSPTRANAFRAQMTGAISQEKERFKNAAVLGLIEVVLFLVGRALEPFYGALGGAALIFAINFLYVYYFGAHIHA